MDIWHSNIKNWLHSTIKVVRKCEVCVCVLGRRILDLALSFLIQGWELQCVILEYCISFYNCTFRLTIFQPVSSDPKTWLNMEGTIWMEGMISLWSENKARPHPIIYNIRKVLYEVLSCIICILLLRSDH